uniref:Uncharacterized protein n=1 Tax=Stomoxys calcitrans TaxID=35570 RepID=A0A1I8Q729_STOCA
TQTRDNLIAAAPREKHESKTSPWGCFYCSADVKVSEDAIKALKTGKNKKDNESKTAFHTYQQRKTFGQGMMDLALLTANVNQLRAILDAKMKHPYYHVNYAM